MVDYSSVINSSFIDEFDINRHNIEDYKLIILLGDSEINGVNLDGKCIFIPFMESEKNRVSRSCIFEHKKYMAYAFMKYNFGEHNREIREAMRDTISGNVTSERLVSALLKCGHAVFYDMSKSDKNMLLFAPNELTDKQKESIEVFREALLNSEYIFSIDCLNKSGQDSFKKFQLKPLQNKIH